MNKIMTFLIGIAGLCLVSCQNDDIIASVTTDALALLPADTRVGIRAEITDESTETRSGSTTYYALDEIHADKEVSFTMYLPGASDGVNGGNWQRYGTGTLKTLDDIEPYSTLMLKDFNLTEGDRRPVSRWTVLYASSSRKDNLWGWARLTADDNGQPVLNYAMQRANAKVTIIVQDENGQPVNVADVSATLSLPQTLSEVIYTPEGETAGELLCFYLRDNVETLAADETIDPNRIVLGTFADGTENTDFTFDGMVMADGIGSYYGDQSNTLTAIVPATATHTTTDNTTYTPIAGGPQFDGSEKLTITVNTDPDGDGPQTTGTYSLKLKDVKLSDGSNLTALKLGEHYTLTVTLKHNTLVSATATISAWSTASADAEMDGEDGAKLPDNNTNP